MTSYQNRRKRLPLFALIGLFISLLPSLAVPNGNGNGNGVYDGYPIQPLMVEESGAEIVLEGHYYRENQSYKSEDDTYTNTTFLEYLKYRKNSLSGCSNRTSERSVNVSL